MYMYAYLCVCMYTWQRPEALDHLDLELQVLENMGSKNWTWVHYTSSKSLTDKLSDLVSFNFPTRQKEPSSLSQYHFDIPSAYVCLVLTQCVTLYKDKLSFYVIPTPVLKSPISPKSCRALFLFVFKNGIGNKDLYAWFTAFSLSRQNKEIHSWVLMCLYTYFYNQFCT